MGAHQIQLAAANPRTRGTTLRAWLTLARTQTAAVTAVAPVWGALAARPDLDFARVAILFAIGLMSHVYGFVLNEVVDVELDKRSGELVGKPLVAGTIARKVALAVALAQVPLAIIVGTRAFGLNLSALLVIVASVLLATLYDVAGKHFPIPPLADFALALSVGLMVVYGALVVSPHPDLPPLYKGGNFALALAALSSLQIIFNNGVEGGVKDLENDTRMNARTTARWLGARTRNGALVLAPALIVYALALKLASVVIAGAVLFNVREFGLTPNGIALAAFAALCLALMLNTLRRFLAWRGVLDRSALKALFSRHEIATYALAVAVAAPRVGWSWALILLTLPLLWFVLTNLVLYGRALEPAV